MGSALRMNKVSWSFVSAGTLFEPSMMMPVLAINTPMPFIACSVVIFPNRIWVMPSIKTRNPDFFTFALRSACLVPLT